MEKVTCEIECVPDERGPSKRYRVIVRSKRNPCDALLCRSPFEAIGFAAHAMLVPIADMELPPKSEPEVVIA